MATGPVENSGAGDSNFAFDIQSASARTVPIAHSRDAHHTADHTCREQVHGEHRSCATPDLPIGDEMTALNFQISLFHGSPIRAAIRGQHRQKARKRSTTQTTALLTIFTGLPSFVTIPVLWLRGKPNSSLREE